MQALIPRKLDHNRSTINKLAIDEAVCDERIFYCQHHGTYALQSIVIPNGLAPKGYRLYLPGDIC
jgi:hypothetical protein